jgi:hypothetical protein
MVTNSELGGNTMDKCQNCGVEVSEGKFCQDCREVLCAIQEVDLNGKSIQEGLDYAWGKI